MKLHIVFLITCGYFLSGELTSVELRAAEGEIAIHVAPNGTDNSDNGSADGSASLPYATFERALEAAAVHAHRDRKSSLAVVAQAGIFRVVAPIIISRPHVPAQGSLTLRAVDGAHVVISGGRTIAGWQLQADGTWEAELPTAIREQLPIRELFVNGERRPRARHPNSGFLRIDQAFPDKRSGFTVPPDKLPRSWTGGGELVFLHDWSISRIPVAKMEHDSLRLTSSFTIGNQAAHYKIDHFEKHPRFFLENHKAFFDAPGEWLVDSSRGVLHYSPKHGETPENTEFVVPIATRLLEVVGGEDQPLRNVHIQGLHFQHSAWSLPAGGYASSQATAYEDRSGSPSSGSRAFIPVALRFELAENCSFARGSISQLGTSGISFGSRTRDCRLEDSLIDDVSGNGVNLGEDTSRVVSGAAWWSSAPEQVASGHIVARNRITRCGQQFFGAVAVWGGIARELKIRNNEISWHPYTGVSLGWMWNPTPTPAAQNVVAENHIHHVMQVLSDGGGIYTLGRQPGSRLVGNVIHDVPLNAGRAESNGMFLDEGSDDVTIAENTIYGIDRSPLRFHKAERLLVRDNTLVYKDSEIPPLRYNNTRPETIEQVNNRVIVADRFDVSTVVLPPTGPQD